MMLRLLIMFTLTVWSAQLFAQPSARQLELARKYVETRGGILQAGTTSAAVLTPSERAFLDVAVEQVAQDLKRAPEWNRNHPSWLHVVGTIRQDIEDALVQVTADPRYAAINDRTWFRIELPEFSPPTPFEPSVA